MIDSKRPTIADMPRIASLDELYSIAILLGQNVIGACERLKLELEACRNGPTVQVFEDLADREFAHIHSIRRHIRL